MYSQHPEEKIHKSEKYWFSCELTRILLWTMIELQNEIHWVDW